MAVEEPTLLLPMQWIVRGVHVQDHLLWRLRMGFHKHLQQERVHPCRVGHGLLVSPLRSLHRGPLQPVQGALARQRLASIGLPVPELPRQVVPVAQQRQEPIPAQLVVVVEILVAQAQPVHPLLDQRFDGRLDPIRIPMIGEALAEPTQNPGPLLHFAQQDASSVGGDLAAIEPAHDVSSVQALKHELCSGTLCGHKIVFLWFCKWLIQKNLYHRTRPLSIFLMRFPG